MSMLHNLCEKWSGKGLYECQRRQVGSEVTFVVTVGKDRTLVDPYGKHAGAYILAAVIEAIEARGWWWKLHRYGTWPHLVRGHVGPDPLSAVPRLGEGPTPAAALLTAYLAALEAEADQ